MNVDRFGWLGDDTIEIVKSRTAGGSGSGNFGHSGRPGEVGGSDLSGMSDRARNALISYKPTRRAEQKIAAQSERIVAKAIGGTDLDDNEPMDIVVDTPNGVHGVEVKTLLRNKNDKLTMTDGSLERKAQWLRKNHATGHTVVVDKRQSPTTYYHREGFGSFRVHTMDQATLSQLRKLIHA